MIIGYCITGSDNNCNMYQDAFDVKKCNKCGYVTDFEYVNPTMKIKRRVYDFSYTYDGRSIVSLKFKEFCIRKNLTGIRFLDLPNDKDFFYMIVDNIVKFDYKKAKTRFETYCDECKMYRQVAGVGFFPLILDNKESELKRGIYSTDINFGSYNELGPLIIVSNDIYKEMKEEKLKGISYEKIEK